MSKTITIQRDNPISEQRRYDALKNINDNLTDDQLFKLSQMAKSPKAKKQLDNNWAFISKMVL